MASLAELTAQVVALTGECQAVTARLQVTEQQLVIQQQGAGNGGGGG